MTRRFPALVGLVLFIDAANTHGQDQLPANGSEVFRFALHLHQIKPAASAREILTDPHNLIVVVFGDIHPPNQFPGPILGRQLHDFVRAGGAVLIATDGPVWGGAVGAGRPDDWGNMFGIQITDQALTAAPQDCHRGLASRPFVKPRARVEFGPPSPFDLFKDADQEGALPVATRRPREMAAPRAGGFLVKNLAGYVDGTRRVANNQPIDQAWNHFALSLQPQPGRGDDPTGRMIVVANRGVYVNEMTGFVRENNPQGYRLDNGNLAFSKRTIEWLQGGPPQPRRKCLFIEDGRVVDRFAQEPSANARPPMPKIPPDVIANWLLNSANPIIEEAQERDAFNRGLERWPGFPRIVKTFLIVMTVLFVLVGLRWLLRGQRKAEPAATLTPGARDALLPRGGVLRQRTASQLEVGNLYEAARRRVRERFDVLGGRPGSSGQMPPVLTANDLPDGPLVYQSVRWLWALGYGDTPVAIPPTDWDRTNVLLERVTARAARGDWSFGQEAG